MSQRTSLSRHDPDENEFNASIAELHSGSDRVAAIMGAAMVENALVAGIESALLDAEDTAALFYDEKGPFNTFYARIVGAKALGLYSTKLASDLHIVRDIRNQFAHSLLSIDFNHPDIVALCARLQPYRKWELPERDISETRLRFENACFGLTMILTLVTRGLLEALDALIDPGATFENLKAARLQARTKDFERDFTTGDE